MREAKIPTIIGILVLIIGMVAGVFLVQSRRLFRLGAQGSFSPKDVRVGNIGDNSFTVSWVTDAVSSGFVLSGENQNSLGNITQDETGESGFIHLATLINLKPQTSYFLKINSGGQEFDNNGVPWKVETGPALERPVKSSIVSGIILKKDGAPPKGALVYITISGSLLSTLASADGNWVIPISQTRTPDLTSYVNIDREKTLLEVSVEAGPEGVAQAQIYPKSANPMPVITLGRVYDFRSLPENKEGEPPKSEVELPAGGTPSSGFEVPQNLGTPTSTIVTLESVKEGEIVASTNPEFFGEGPGGTIITIKVESEAQTTQIKIPSSGSWKWSPPQGLSEGAHRLTLTWIDAAGITRTLTRTFIVQAGEGPAFESTPSATLTPTPSPSPTPTPTPLPTATATVTPVPIPQSGGLTTTLLFSILGVGVIFASFAVWKLSN